jgi:Predicted membrane protein
LLLLLAAIIVIVALLVSGLRLVMPHLNSYRSDILQTISRVSGVTVDASELQGKWENFGPTLQVRDLNVMMPDDGKLTIGRVNLALNSLAISAALALAVPRSHLLAITGGSQPSIAHQ